MFSPLSELLGSGAIDFEKFSLSAVEVFFFFFFFFFFPVHHGFGSKSIPPLGTTVLTNRDFRVFSVSDGDLPQGLHPTGFDHRHINNACFEKRKRVKRGRR